MVRHGLRKIIEADSALKTEVIAEVADGRQAIDLIRRLQPGLVILDTDLPELDGMSVARMASAERLPVELIFFTARHSMEIYTGALALGVKGYLIRESSIEEISHGIRMVVSGQSYISSALLVQLIAPPSEQQYGQPIGFNPDVLTLAEYRVLALVAEYKTTREIGAELSISYRTVQTHCNNMRQKLGISGKYGLLKFACLHKNQLL